MTPPRPFLGTEAIATGQLTRRGLRSKCRKIFRNVYVGNDVELTPVILAEAAWLFAGGKAVLAGNSAAAMLGTKWIDPRLPPELARADAGCPGLTVLRDKLGDDEILTRGGVALTTPARTAYDLGRRPGFTEAVIRLDALANATGLTRAEVETVADRHPGTRGIVQLRRVLTVMDAGAESPPETKTRLALLADNLPAPQTQLAVYDQLGYPFARLDMGYEQWKVGIDYDGAQHWTDPRQRAHDAERLHELMGLGWILVRVNAEILRERPWAVARRTREALRRNGCPWA